MPASAPLALGDTVVSTCASVTGVVDDPGLLSDRYPLGRQLTVVVSSRDGVMVRLADVHADRTFAIAGLQPGDYYVALHLEAFGIGDTGYQGTTISTDRYLWGSDVMTEVPPLHIGPGCTSVRGLQLTGAPVESGSVVTASPARVLDLPVAGFAPPDCIRVASANVPAGASGVVVNVTSAAPGTVGNVVLFPDNGASPPDAPNAVSVSFEPGRDVAAAAFVSVGANGRICLHSQSFAPSRVLVDIVGFVMPGSGLVSQTAQRLVDTRPGYRTGDLATPLRANAPYELQVAGRAGVPDDAAAVILDVTAVQPTGAGNLRVYPANGGGVPPTVSTLNYAPGATKSNAAVVPLANGRIGFYSDTAATTPVDLVLDVVGYVAAGRATYRPLTPTRVLDTRPGAAPSLRVLPTLHAGGVVSLDVKATGALRSYLFPSYVTGLVLNVTAIGPTTVGNLRVYPDTAGNGSTAPPNASSINYVPGRDIPNLVVVAVPPDGRVDFYTDQLAGGTVDLAVDVVGYIATGTG